MKTTSVALFALLATAPFAFAQTAPPPASPPAAATTPSGQLQYYTRQPDEMRASKLIGTTVRNEANEAVGDINEVILSRDGKVAAVVIGVGGFLGMGEREVALDFKSLRIEHDSKATTEGGATVIKVNATKDALKAAPAWIWSGAATGTSGTARPQ